MSGRISALEMAVGFEIGAYDRVQLADWVDTEVMACDRIEGPLLELTTLGDKSDHAIVADLYELAGVGPDLSTHLWLACLAAGRMHLVIACMGRMVEAERVDLGLAIAHLYAQAYGGNDLTEDERSALLHLEYGYELAVAQTWGTLDDVRAEFFAFTSRYRHLLASVR